MFRLVSDSARPSLSRNTRVPVLAIGMCVGAPRKLQAIQVMEFRGISYFGLEEISTSLGADLNGTR